MTVIGVRCERVLPMMLAFALTLATHVARSETTSNVTVPHITVPAALDRSLSIRLEGVSANVHWLTAFVPADVASPVANLFSKDVGPQKTPVALSPDQFQVSSGSIVIKPVGLTSGSVAIFVRVPVGTPARIMGDDGRNLFSSLIKAGLLVQDGAISTQPISRIGQLVLSVYALEHSVSFHTASVAQTDGGVRTFRGARVITISEARQHLLAFSRGRAPEGAAPCCSGVKGEPRPASTGSGLARLTVGESGAVSDVVKLQGDESLFRPFAASARSWTFRPFETDGKPVLATFLVPYFNRDGFLDSALVDFKMETGR